MTEKKRQVTLNPPAKKRSVRFITGSIAWVLGLLLTASDGPYMPWGNLLGVFIFLGATLMFLGEDREMAVDPAEDFGHSLAEPNRNAKKNLVNQNGFSRFSDIFTPSGFEYKVEKQAPS